MRTAILFSTAILFGVAACGGTEEGVLPNPNPTPAPTPTPTPTPVPGDIELEAGKGEETWTAISPGEELPLVSALQGGGGGGPPGSGGGFGTHFWIALRARNLDPANVSVRVRLTRVDTGAEVSNINRRAAFEASGDDFVLTGWQAVVVCNDVRGAELELTVEVTDSAGKTGTDTTRFKAPALCPRGGFG